MYKAEVVEKKKKNILGRKQQEKVEKKKIHFIRNVPDRSCKEKENTFY
jgi:hypothetical protein